MVTTSSVRALSDVRLPSGEQADILIEDGIVTAVGPGLAADRADVVHGARRLVLPGFVDGHMHLDKTLTGLPWMPHRAGPERASRIETERRMRAELPPVAPRAARLVADCVGHGTTAMRSHVDVDDAIGLSHVAALLAVREAAAAHVDLQLVAFPQSGVLNRPGVRSLLDAAIAAGCDLLGGIDPVAIDGDLDGQLDVLFAIAERRGVGLDIHLHDPGAAGMAEIAGVVERTRVHGMAGHVTVSHGFCLGAADDSDLERLAASMAEAGVALVTHGGGASPMPPVKRLRERGVTVFAGNDDIRDPWSPLGTGDMLERAMLIAWRGGYRTDADLAVALDVATTSGAQGLGLPRHGPCVGSRADLVLVDAETPAEAVARRPGRALVLKGGRVVARDGALTEPLVLA